MALLLSTEICFDLFPDKARHIHKPNKPMSIN